MKKKKKMINFYLFFKFINYYFFNWTVNFNFFLINVFFLNKYCFWKYNKTTSENPIFFYFLNYLIFKLTKFNL